MLIISPVNAYFALVMQFLQLVFIFVRKALFVFVLYTSVNILTELWIKIITIFKKNFIIIITIISIIIIIIIILIITIFDR